MTRSKFSCPACGSSNTRSHPAIVASGSSTGIGSGSVSSGNGFSRRMETEIHSTTELAELCAKPEPATTIREMVGPLIAFLGFPGAQISRFLSRLMYTPLTEHPDPPSFYVLQATVFVVGLVIWHWGRAAANDLNEDLDERVKEWENTWRCLRCMQSFVPEK